MATVESSSSANNTSTDPNVALVLTKPTGLAVGDLMVVMIIAEGINLTTCTASGFSNDESITGENARMFLLSKTATSGDVAASDFTFTTNFDGTGTGNIAGGMVRVSDWATTEAIITDAGSDFNRNTTAANISGLSVTPNADNSVLLIGLMAEGNEHGGVTFSGYTINGTNPTWTEQFEEQETTGDDLSISVATATQTTAAEITTVSATSSGTVDDFHAFVVSVTPIVNTTGTVALLEPSITFLSPSVEVGTTGTNALLEPATDLNTQRGVGTQPTNWTTRNKRSDTWTNPDK